MDWLNDIATAVKSAPSISSTPPKQDSKPTHPQTDTKPTSAKTDSKPQTDTKPTESRPPDMDQEQKPDNLAPKPKSGAADWLGLNDADDEDEEPVVSWMTAKSKQKVKFSGFQILHDQNLFYFFPSFLFIFFSICFQHAPHGCRVYDFENL